MVTEFKVGDVVELRSGGPAMTVMGHEEGEPFRLLCSYFLTGGLTTLGFEPGVLTMSSQQAPTSEWKDGMIDAVAR